VNRCWSRSRSRVFPRGASARRPFALGSRCLASRGPGSPRARSPSLPIGTLRAVHAKRRRTLLWIRLPPNDFCNLLPTHGHTPEHPILAFSMRPAFRRDAEFALAFADACLGRRQPSPLEEGTREPRAATILPKPARRRCKHAVKQDLESHPPIETPLAGDASIRPPFAAMAVG